MSYLPNMSFKGALDADVFHNSVNYKIPDGFLSVSFSIVLNGSGTLRLFSSNDNVSYRQVASRVIDQQPFQFEVFQLSGLYFKWTYQNGGVAETNLQIAVKISTDDVNTIISGDLNMGGHNIVDAGTISCSTLEYTTLDPPIPPSEWVATATSNLNMANYDITDVSGIRMYGTLNVDTIDTILGELNISSAMKCTSIKTDTLEGLTNPVIGVNSDLAMNNFKISEADEITAIKYSNQAGSRSLTLDETSIMTSNLQLGSAIEYNLNCYKSTTNITDCISLGLTINPDYTEIQIENDLQLKTHNIIGATDIGCSTINGLPANLTAGDGIDITGNVISTVGNPEIGLTYRSYYVNEGEKDLQTALTEASGLQAVNIYMSGGSFGGADITITGQTNQNIIAPNNVGTICEIGSSGTPRNLTITNSTRVCVNNLQINGNLTINGTGTAHKFLRCNFKSGVVSLTGLTGGFVVFENCEWSNSSVVHLAGFAGVVYYINCNFGNATWTCDQPLASQVILNNCAGLTSFTSPAKRTLVGLCTLTTGVANVNTNNINTTTINGSAYPPTTFDPENQNPVKYGSSGVGTGAGTRSVSIGDGSGSNPTFPNAQDSIAIGTGSNARANDTIALGRFALVSASEGIAIGLEAFSPGLSIAIGNEACVNTGNSQNGVYIGHRVGTGSSGLIQESTIIGYQAGFNTQSIQESVVIGNSAWNTTNCLNVVAVGRNCGQNSTGSNVISIGNNSSLAIDSKNVVIGNGCFNGTGGLTRGCIILGNDICNFTGVSNNSLIINNSQSSFDPPAVENAVYVANMRNTSLDYLSYPNASNAITYNDQTKEISKQRVFISRGQLDGGNPATLTFNDSMFDDASKVVVLFDKQTFNHPNNGNISFTIGGGQLVFTSTHNGDNDFIGVQAYRIAL